jgi:hypothetical protein
VCYTISVDPTNHPPTGRTPDTVVIASYIAALVMPIIHRLTLLLTDWHSPTQTNQPPTHRQKRKVASHERVVATRVCI